MYKQRITERSEGIRDWLKKNKLEEYLIKSDTLLDSLDKEKIKNEFKDFIQQAIVHCVENEDIKALDFQWSYSGSPVYGAFAYGLNDCTCDGTLSNSDLGPKDIPGIEVDIKHGDQIDEDFSELPVYHAINLYVERMEPNIFQSEILGPLWGVTDTLLTDYFQIWNYKIACEVFEEFETDGGLDELKDRAPFWITMTRQDRYSVVVMVVN